MKFSDVLHETAFHIIIIDHFGGKKKELKSETYFVIFLIGHEESILFLSYRVFGIMVLYASGLEKKK